MEWISIDLIAFSLRGGGLDQTNDNYIIMNPKEALVSNLSPYQIKL